MIGQWSNERLACGDTVHLLATVNPLMCSTWCLCGQARAGGVDHETWHERFVYDGAGQGAQLIGYDRYTLGACPCHKGGVMEAGQ